jgi:hypothetical protein
MLKILQNISISQPITHAKSQNSLNVSIHYVQLSALKESHYININYPSAPDTYVLCINSFIIVIKSISTIYHHAPQHWHNIHVNTLCASQHTEYRAAHQYQPNTYSMSRYFLIIQILHVHPNILPSTKYSSNFPVPHYHHTLKTSLKFTTNLTFSQHYNTPTLFQYSTVIPTFILLQNIWCLLQHVNGKPTFSHCSRSLSLAQNLSIA